MFKENCMFKDQIEKKSIYLGINLDKHLKYV